MFQTSSIKAGVKMKLALFTIIDECANAVMLETFIAHQIFKMVKAGNPC